ncbi:MAG: hypothetical protein JWM14_1562 [Chitinophagaceae bacterium]|nr:hypothetical protein [Chitinophagaceae bacterium]
MAFYYLVCSLFGEMKLVLTLFSLLITLHSFAQKEARNWYFGDQWGFNFSNTPPTLTHNSGSHSIFGMAVASDSQGNLLFYTNGINVWNVDHQIMTNGSGLKGHQGLGQSAVIVPVENETIKKYYIFTSDGGTFNMGFPNDSVFAYSVVDMSLKGGKGDVTIKNEILISPVNESVAAVKHANGIDTWVLTHKLNTNEFYAYLVSACGVSSPVISNEGPIQLEFYQNYLKISPNGKKISYAFGPGTQKQYVFDFDNTSGLVTNSLSLGENSGFVRCSFSPNSRYLYTEGTLPPTGDLVFLNQYDLLASDIPASLKSIADTSISAMQLGIDGKLYIATSRTKQFIDVLHNPNEPLDQANYQREAYVVEGNQGVNGFPNFIESYFSPDFAYVIPVRPTFFSNRVCIGDSTSFNSQNTTAVQSFHWDFGEPASGSNNHSTLTNPKHLYQKTGQYNVQCVFQNSICNDTIIQIIKVDSLPFVSLGNDIHRTTCNNEPIMLDAGKGFSSYLWQDNSTNQTLATTNKGTYSVKVTNSCGIYTGSITIEKSTYSIPNLITPNNDNKNDQFEIITQGEKGKLSIWNSWGAEVYKNDFYDNSWDASNVGAGLYYYSYQLLDCPVNAGWLQVIK